VYLLFSGSDYYPQGGMDDFQGEFESMEGAKQFFEKNKDDWAHIVEKDSMSIVSNFYEENGQYLAFWGMDKSKRVLRDEYIEDKKRFKNVCYSSRQENGKYEYVGDADYAEDARLSQECLKLAERNGERVLK
jgi:hypothetical protein